MTSTTGISGPNGTVPAARASSRSVVLDGLRFLAAGLIVLYHYQSEGPWPLDRLSPVFLRGYLATDFFLILSGYVLGRAYGRKIAGGTVSDERFLLLRVMRVWPAHLVMLAAFAVVIALGVALGAPPAHPDQYQLSDLPSQALLIHAWGPHTGSGWNLPTWSLSALVICYAAFPTLWRKLNRVGASLLLFIGGLAAVWAADLVSRTLYHHALFDLPFNLGVLRALPLFVFGACIARAGELDWPPSRWAVWLAVASGLLVTVLQGFGRFDLMSVALLGLLVGAGGAVRTSRGQQVAAKAGQISFALYITHIFVAMIWFHATRMIVARFAPPEWLQWVMWGLALSAAIATAIAFERLVDQPLQKAVGRLISWRPARYRELARSE